MIVYVAINTWDTPDNEGSEILGVYSNFEKAREQIEVGADAIRKEFDENFWDEDMTWDEPSEIHLGRDERGYSNPATIYSWEIVQREVE